MGQEGEAAWTLQVKFLKRKACADRVQKPAYQCPNVSADGHVPSV